MDEQIVISKWYYGREKQKPLMQQKIYKKQGRMNIGEIDKRLEIAQ